MAVEQSQPNSTELEIGHRIIKVATPEHVDTVIAQLRTSFQRGKLAGFDLDGTIIGENVVFPRSGIDALKSSGMKVTTVSGAGPLSIVRKIGSGLGYTPDRLSAVFNAPFAGNEGAHVFHQDVDLQSVSHRDILEETAITGDSSSFLSDVARRYTSEVEFYGFYPSRAYAEAHPELSPFEYVIFAQQQETVDKLREKYRKLTAVDDINVYLGFLQIAGASKFVVKAPEQVRAELGKQLVHPGVRATTNEGYLNVVAAGTDKLNALLRVAKLDETLPDDLSTDEIFHFGNDGNDLEALIGVGTGFVIDSNPEMTEQLVRMIDADKKTGNTLVVDPRMTNDLLMRIGEVRTNG